MWGRNFKTFRLVPLIPPSDFRAKRRSSHVNELLLLLVRHVSQAVVASGQVSLQAGQGRHHHALHLAALRPRAGRGEAQSADAAAGPDAGRQDVFLVEHGVGDLEEEGMPFNVRGGGGGRGSRVWSGDVVV